MVHLQGGPKQALRRHMQGRNDNICPSLACYYYCTTASRPNRLVIGNSTDPSTVVAFQHVFGVTVLCEFEFSGCEQMKGDCTFAEQGRYVIVVALATLPLCRLSCKNLPYSM